MPGPVWHGQPQEAVTHCPACRVSAFFIDQETAQWVWSNHWLACSATASAYALNAPVMATTT